MSVSDRLRAYLKLYFAQQAMKDLLASYIEEMRKTEGKLDQNEVIEFQRITGKTSPL